MWTWNTRNYTTRVEDSFKFTFRTFISPISLRIVDLTETILSHGLKCRELWFKMSGTMNTFRTQRHKINPTKSTKIIIRHNVVLVSTRTNSMRWSHTSECIKCKVAEVLYVILQNFLLTASQTILIYRQKIWNLRLSLNLESTLLDGWPNH